MRSFQDILKNTENLLKETAVYINAKAGHLKNTDTSIEEKYINNLVTEVDKESERRLIKGLSEILPGSGFIAEEGTVAEDNSDWKWIIDPIDGTTNFIHQIPSYAISVALTYKNTLKVSAVLELNRMEMFTAIENEGAYLNGVKIAISPTNELKDSLLATGFPYFRFEGMEAYLKVLSQFMEKTRGLRRLGAASIDLCYVACGKFDAYFEFNLSPWDVAGGALIVKEAGGVVSDFYGGENWKDGSTILAANPHIHNQMIEIIKPEF